MMGAMTSPCLHCGEDTVVERSRFEVLVPPDARVIMEEVPALRCPACEVAEPASHVKAQLNAMIELAGDVEGAVMRKDFSAVPLHAEDPPA